MKSFKPYPFKVTKDRKQGLIITTPKIPWKELSEDQAKVQWHYCTNVLWNMEKEGHISKDDLIRRFYRLLEIVKVPNHIIQEVYIVIT